MDKELAKLELRLRAADEALGEQLISYIDMKYSAVVEKLDAFMAQTMAVRTDHTFFIYRLDDYEKRLKRLEQERK